MSIDSDSMMEFVEFVCRMGGSTEMTQEKFVAHLQKGDLTQKEVVFYLKFLCREKITNMSVRELMTFMEDKDAPPQLREACRLRLFSEQVMFERYRELKKQAKLMMEVALLNKDEELKKQAQLKYEEVKEIADFIFKER